MSYTKTTWNTGDTITAEKMNKIEDGVESAFGFSEQLNALIDGSITEITIPADVTKIGQGAFYGRESLESVTIHDNVTEIGNYAFQYCSALESIDIPNSVTRIGHGVFSSSGLKSADKKRQASGWTGCLRVSDADQASLVQLTSDVCGLRLTRRPH